MEWAKETTGIFSKAHLALHIKQNKAPLSRVTEGRTH